MSASGGIGPNATRIRLVHSMAISSCMSDACHAIEGDEKRVPDTALAREHLASLAGDPVVAAPTLAAFLDPASGDQSAVLQAVERRVERRNVEVDRALRSLGDQPADFVAVPLALFSSARISSSALPRFSSRSSLYVTIYGHDEYSARSAMQTSEPARAEPREPPSRVALRRPRRSGARRERSELRRASGAD